MDRSIDVGDTLDLSVSSSNSEDSSSESEYNWITWFATMRGNELFCQVDEAYIRDDFNLTGLNAIVSSARSDS